MEYLNVTDIYKIGVGPSSSHTLGPWRAALQWATNHCSREDLVSVKIVLYGSLSLTGKGHATDIAVMMGLSGLIPSETNSQKVEEKLEEIRKNAILKINGLFPIYFDPDINIVFTDSFKDFHPNALTFQLVNGEGKLEETTYYSLGGGFFCQEDQADMEEVKDAHPYPVNSAKELEDYSEKHGLTIPEIACANELAYHSFTFTKHFLLTIWEVMKSCIYQGIHTEGVLPGGLQVKRRAMHLYRKLHPAQDYNNVDEWVDRMKLHTINHQNIFKWVSAFAMAVNEENAAMGRVVTAPTNGSAGVIPAVLLYYVLFVNPESTDQEVIDFLFVASEIGCLFKKGATISAAMGGCQAEIGVSSAMAAAGLTYLLGGNTPQCLTAAEIAMEHHLGLTCDPINGLVQVPCIERNSMGAIKAINAANIAIDLDPKDAKVPLDKVIKTMWNTAQDMHRKYKETSEGGLATTVNEVEC